MAKREPTVPISWWRRLRLVLVDGGLLLLLCSPTFPHLLQVLRRREAWNSFIPSDPPLYSVLASLNALHFVAIPVVSWLLVRTFRTGFRIPTPQPVVAMACWWLIPVLAAWVATRADVARLFFPRYLVSSAAGAVLLGTLCLGTALPWRAVLRLVSLATLVVALTLDGYVLGLLTEGPRPLRREDWRGLARVLDAQTADAHRGVGGREPLLLVRSGLIEADGLGPVPIEDPELRAYCGYMFAGIYRLPPDRWQIIPVANHSPFGISSSVRREAAERQEVWLAIRAARVRIPELTMEVLEQLSLDGPKWELERQWRFGNLALVLARQKPLGE